MKKLKRILVVLALLLGSTYSNGQGLSTEGQDFWIGFMDNWLQDPNNPIITEVYISADSATTGLLTVPGNPAFTPAHFTVKANSTIKLTLNTSQVQPVGSGNIEKKAIHVTTDQDVSVYAMNKRQFSADMSGILPTFSLGNEYYIMSHWEDDNRNNNDNSNSEFVVLSISDGTQIEITPTVATLDGKPANVPYTITLNEGEVCQVQARGELTGTRVTGINAVGGCQNFSLFSGNQYTKVGHCNDPNGHDHIYKQQYPVNTWGKEFITVSLFTRVGGDIIKVLASEDNTNVQLNSSTFTLNRGEYKAFTLDGINSFTSDKPISIGQFSRSMGCDGTRGDPFLLMISPAEQMITKITFLAPTIATVDVYPMSIVMKTADVASIKLDGKSISSSFATVPGNPQYSYGRLLTAAGIHTLKSSGSGFIAYIYGFGANESFGYTAGASLENLKVSIGITTTTGKTLPADSICLNGVALFTPIVEGLDQFEWFFGDGGTETSLGKNPVSYKFDKVGKYIFKLKASLNGGNCQSSREETYVKIITVVNPKSKILGPRSICPKTTGVSYYVDQKRPYTYKWKVKGGSITENHGDSIVVDWGDTNPNAYVKLVSENKFDCAGDTVTLPIKINIQLQPDAPVGPDTLCSNAMTNIAYNTFFVQNSSYNWSVDPGVISSGQGTNKVTVDWQNYGIGKLWFEQTTTNVDVCGGTSDTLYVYIQRNPSADVTIESDKDEYQIGEQVNLTLQDVDPQYKMLNWNYGDNTSLDSVQIAGTHHTFNCSGNYDIIVNLYDTIGICTTTANDTTGIKVLAISFEMIQVSTLEEHDSTLQVLWKTTNADFLDNVLKLERKNTTTNAVDAMGTFNGKSSVFLNDTTNPFTTVYEYKLSQTSDCVDQDETALQHNILLTAVSEDDLSAKVSWNNYDNWQNGVDRYEMYLRKDDGNFKQLEPQSSDFIYAYDSLGFDYCFRVKAIENGGNAFSWSNIACAQFVPPIKTYNVITPNSDELNDMFIVKGIELYPKSLLTIYNRWGHKVKQIEGYKNNWPYGGENDNLSAGVYFYVIELRDARSKQNTIKGPLSILK
jgi:gliding motility-associated-like protein